MRIVVFSEVKWSYMRTRKRFIVPRFPSNWQILFLEPMNLQAGSHWRPVRDGRVTVATLPALKPSTTVPLLNRLLAGRLFRTLVNALVAAWVWALLLWWGRGRPRVLYLANVMCAPLARWLRPDLVLYDCNDDPVGFRTSPPWVRGYQQVALRVSDLVVSCSRALAARLRERGAGDVRVIGNGVEYAHFARSIDVERLRPEVRGLATPRIGYAGAISNWFDFDLIDAVARAHPQVPVVLMGPVAPDVVERARALGDARPNVLFTGAIPYEDLPDHVGSLDVCLIPFLLGGETDVLNPNKLYEYLAAGRTVVTLAYSEDVQDFADWLLIARDRDEFVDRVGEALAAPADPERLRAVAREHSWDARTAAMVSLIEGGLEEEGRRRGRGPRRRAGEWGTG